MWNQRNREVAFSKPTCSFYRSLKKNTPNSYTSNSGRIKLDLFVLYLHSWSPGLSQGFTDSPRSAHLPSHCAALRVFFLFCFVFLRHVQKYSIKTRILHKNSQISAGCWCREVKVNQLPSHTGTDPQAEISVPESRRKGSFWNYPSVFLAGGQVFLSFSPSSAAPVRAASPSSGSKSGSILIRVNFHCFPAARKRLVDEVMKCGNKTITAWKCMHVRARARERQGERELSQLL